MAGASSAVTRGSASVGERSGPRIGPTCRRPSAPADRRRRGRSTSTSRSACRSVPTATSWSLPVPPPGGRGVVSRPSLPRCAVRSSCARTRSTRPGVAPVDGPRRRRPPSTRSISAAGRRRCCRPATIAALVELVRARFGLAADAEVTHRGESRTRRARRRAGTRGRRRQPDLVRRPGPGRGAPADLGRRHGAEDVAAAVAEARGGRDRVHQPRPPVRRSGPDRRRIRRELERLSVSSPDHLSIYALTLDDPDAEGLTGPAGDHLPTTAGARRWRASARPRQDEDRAAAMYSSPSIDSRRQATRLRDQQLGAPRAREPAQPRLLGAPPVRSRGPGRPRLRRRDRDAGTPPISTRYVGALAAHAAWPAVCHPAAARARVQRPARRARDPRLSRRRGGRGPGSRPALLRPLPCASSRAVAPRRRSAASLFLPPSRAPPSPVAPSCAARALSRPPHSPPPLSSGRRDVRARRRSTRPRRASSATRSATGRVPGTRAATTSPTGRGPRTRPSVRARTPSTAAADAGTPPAWIAISTPSCPRTAVPAACRPAARKRWMPSAHAAEAVILGLRLGQGIPGSWGEQAPLAGAPRLGARRRPARRRPRGSPGAHHAGAGSCRTSSSRASSDEGFERQRAVDARRSRCYHPFER